MKLYIKGGMMSKYFVVNNKPDDYGNCRKELVITTLRNAKQYYHYIEVPESVAAILKLYIDFIDEAEEKERTDEERYYAS